MISNVQDEVVYYIVAAYGFVEEAPTARQYMTSSPHEGFAVG
jgi:hypothetical protein